MQVFTLGKFNVPSPVIATNNPENSSEVSIKNTPLGVKVSISPEAREKQEAEVKQAEKGTVDKKGLGQSLQLEGSILRSSKNDEEQLSAAEKLEQRIEEVKEKIKELKKEIQALKANGSEQASEEIEIIDLQMQALLGELNSLMEQKLESMKKN